MQKRRIVKTDPPNECIARWNGESWFDYFIRLCDNKSKYGLTYDRITVLLNNENGKNYNESTYRKTYVLFTKGREYERNLTSSAIANRILVISDLHVPYQLPVETFEKYIGNVDILVLNGDIMDCQSISFFPKKYRIGFVDEMIAARQYLMDLIDVIMPSRVIITKGNHEHRMLRYLSDRLNEDLLNLMPDSPIDLIINDGFKNNDRFTMTETYYSPLVEVYKDRNIDISYDGEWYHRIGNVMFAHPLAYSASMLKTSEKAVSFFLRSKENRSITAIIMAHTHKVGFYKLGDISIYEQGCCCNLDMLDYADGKLQDPQQNGYMYICLDKNGNIIEDKTKLITSV